MIMGIYGDKKDYETLLKENIQNANLFYNLDEESQVKILKLLEQKEAIVKKNGIFANYQITKINNKINKIRNKKNPKL
jgi:hypothetical protein